MRPWMTAICLLWWIAVPAYSQTQAPAAAAVAVGTVPAERKAIEKTREFVGRVEAIDRVEIRARVKGYLEAVRFTEGAMVKEGDPLYRIEQGLFQAAVGQAQGDLARSKAAKTLTGVQLQRAQTLLSTQTGTVVARDQALAADEQAKAAIMAGEANLKTAEINLGYTEITSPIAGKVGHTSVTKGNVVGPESGTLTIVVSQDPMYVTFPVSQREFLQTQEAGRKVDAKAIKVQLRFANGQLYDRDGSINFVDVTVDRATDTIMVRASFPNPSGILVDGQLVRVLLANITPREEVVIPQSALIADQEGVYVFVVEEGKAITKRVKVAGESGADVVIESGLTGGEQVIVEGLQGLRPGVPVKATPAAASLNRS